MSLPLETSWKENFIGPPGLSGPCEAELLVPATQRVPVKPMNLCMVQSAVSAKVASGAKFCSEYSLSSSSFQVIIDSFPKQQYPLCRDWEQRVVGFTLDKEND